MSDRPRQKLVLVDGNSLLYRAFFALPPLTNTQGEMTNAVYGFTMMLLKVLDEEQPDLVAVAFDLPGPTFRHRRYPEYKATRERMPDELSPQIEMARAVLDAMHIPAYELEGYEADDVIGTLAAKAEQAGHEVLIVTGDLDELQLVSDRVSVLVTRRGITDTHLYDRAAVRERYGFEPEKLPDFRALRGDTTDNIPGVPGVGEKTASALIRDYGSLDSLLEKAEEVKPARIADALQAYGDIARESRELSLIVRDLPLPLDEERLRRRPPDAARLADLFRRLGFRTLLSRFEGPPEPETPSAEHRAISQAKQARALAEELRGEQRLVLHPLAEGGPPLRAKLKGLGLLAGGRAVLLTAEGEGRIGELLAPLKGVLESPSAPKVGHDLKRLTLLLGRHGIMPAGLSFDTMVAAYLVDPSRRSQDLAEVAFDHLPAPAQPREGADRAAGPEAAAAALHDIAALEGRLSEALRELDLWQLFVEMEMPLVPVLADMERTGVALDTGVLAALSSRLAERISELEREIYALAGQEFNISSPKQLREILFDKLGLPPDKSRRTKTGYSTDAAVLAGLSDHEIVAKILEYREVTKLKSTYVDALPKLVDPETGRLHTSLNQTVTATGRLSSSDPNLQNIPVRSELGMEIRRAFVAGLPGHVLLGADYSQIELRILAHITGDENLTEIFLRDEDLHRAAAAEIFGVAPEAVTPPMRSFAKMVNFGIPYGISEFRLGREMGIPVEEARRYVSRYFARFPKVHEYVEEMPRRAREAGYVTTLFGRRRPLPELRTRAPAQRQAAERMAINTPMQGTAADIIKVAMLRVAEGLRDRGLGARMILQVHDELLLEVPEAEVRDTARLVADCMSQAYQLRVPLKVAVRAGPNWLEMEPVDTRG